MAKAIGDIATRVDMLLGKAVTAANRAEDMGEPMLFKGKALKHRNAAYGTAAGHVREAQSLLGKQVHEALVPGLDAIAGELELAAKTAGWSKTTFWYPSLPIKRERAFLQAISDPAATAERGIGPSIDALTRNVGDDGPELYALLTRTQGRTSAVSTLGSEQAVREEVARLVPLDSPSPLEGARLWWLLQSMGDRAFQGYIADARGMLERTTRAVFAEGRSGIPGDLAQAVGSLRAVLAQHTAESARARVGQIVAQDPATLPVADLAELHRLMAGAGATPKIELGDRQALSVALDGFIRVTGSRKRLLPAFVGARAYLAPPSVDQVVTELRTLLQRSVHELDGAGRARLAVLLDLAPSGSLLDQETTSALPAAIGDRASITHANTTLQQLNQRLFTKSEAAAEFERAISAVATGQPVDPQRLANAVRLHGAPSLPTEQRLTVLTQAALAPLDQPTREAVESAILVTARDAGLGGGALYEIVSRYVQRMQRRDSESLQYLLMDAGLAISRHPNPGMSKAPVSADSSALRDQLRSIHTASTRTTFGYDETAALVSRVQSTVGAAGPEQIHLVPRLAALDKQAWSLWYHPAHGRDEAAARRFTSAVERLLADVQ